MNSADIAEWLVSSGVRSRYSQDGAVLLDLRHGHYYTLNGVAARVWALIETSPSGIAAEDIVDVLETHFKAPREELESDATQCLVDLQRAGLVRERVAVRDEPSTDRISASSPSGAPHPAVLDRPDFVTAARAPTLPSDPWIRLSSASPGQRPSDEGFRTNSASWRTTGT